jgi:hypothetical protein
MTDVVLHGLLAPLAARVGDSGTPSTTLPREGEGASVGGTLHV